MTDSSSDNNPVADMAGELMMAKMDAASMKGGMTHFKGIKDQQFISTATLSVIDMIDLHRNLVESIDIELERERLEERVKKTN